MLEIENLKIELQCYDDLLDNLKDSLDINSLKQNIKKLEDLTMDPNFWNDQKNSQVVLQEIKSKKLKVENFEKLSTDYDDLLTFFDLAIEENEVSLKDEIKLNYKNFVSNYEELRINTLLNGEYDKNNAILTLHSGAGGTESCDWVAMLLRMYSRYAEKKDYKIEILDSLDGEGAGLKSVTILVIGENAYGYLKAEKGVHRLIRISPFDSSGRRHTSFASCDVIPELDDSITVKISTDDLKIDTYRASGAGGQHVNKTESAIRITHLPSGVVVQCQNERSQHKNKDRAMKMLAAKLYELKELEQTEKFSDIRGEIKDNSFGSQVRSYVFHPYNMVKDHRTNEEVGNVNAVMDGSLDNFINAYLKYNTKKTNL